MSNVLDKQKQHDVVALGRLGWSLRRIEAATGVRRETVGEYLRQAGIAVHGRGRRSEGRAKAAISSPAVSTDRAAKPAIVSGVSTDSVPARAPSASACAIYREVITAALARGRNAMAIWQDLVDDHGFPAGYASVRRFVRSLRETPTAEARVVITTAPGEEAQVDYGEGQAVARGDSAAILAHYADDALILGSGAPMLQGKPARLIAVVDMTSVVK